jgi:hypothetical protein
MPVGSVGALEAATSQPNWVQSPGLCATERAPVSAVRMNNSTNRCGSAARSFVISVMVTREVCHLSGTISMLRGPRGGEMFVSRQTGTPPAPSGARALPSAPGNADELPPVDSDRWPEPTKERSPKSRLCSSVISEKCSSRRHAPRTQRLTPRCARRARAAMPSGTAAAFSSVVPLVTVRQPSLWVNP